MLDGGAIGASHVAAGLWNPVTFRKPGKSWWVDELLPELEKQYRHWETELGTHFFHPKPYIRVFQSIEEQNNWIARSSDPAYERYLGEVSAKSPVADVHAPFGVGEVHGAGYLDIPAFLKAVRRYLVESGSLVNESFVPEHLHLSSGTVSYEGNSQTIHAEKIIFCDGLRAWDNPWFSWLPFQPVKGEVLRLRISGLSSTHIIHNGHFLCPIGNGEFRLGATYDWKNLDRTPTKEAADLLLKTLEQVYQGPYEVVDHAAGIRPSVKGRRPLIGQHPEEPCVWLFNGMGSKAVMLAPRFAKHLIHHWKIGEELLRDVNLVRFYNAYEPPTFGS